MKAQPELEPLLRPFQIGAVEIRNRLFLPAHTTNLGERNLPTERYAAYLRERARGGAGLVISEPLRVHPTAVGRSLSLGGYDDAAVPRLAALAEAVHAEGSAIFGQLLHLGRQAGGHGQLVSSWGPSPIPWAAGAHVPHEMTRADIATLIRSFASAAGRLRDAGYDGFEVHLGHGHLLQQFLSPAVNRRGDGYGGDAERRLRLPREVLAAAIDEAGPGLAVGIRVSADEFLAGGLDLEATLEITGRLLSELPLAFVNVSHSAYVGTASLSTQIADMSWGSAPFRAFPAAFKKAFPALAVLGACRLDTAELAAEMVAAGELDVAGLVRAQLADPWLLRKATEGRREETRSCIACNQGCIGRIELSLPIRCVVNPEGGQELEWARARSAAPPRRGLRVLVAGGGPAGLQAALSARRQGHSVRLLEALERLGGQVWGAASLHGRERLGLLASELERDVRASGVEVATGRAAVSAEVLDGGWDAVVVATGSEPRPRSLEGASRVLTPLEAASTELGQRVAILDDEGGWAAAALAEQLAANGRAVDLLVAHAALAWRITTYSRLALVERLGKLGVRARLLRRALRLAPEGLVVADSMSGDEELLEGVTDVVHAGLPAARDSLFRELEEAGYAGSLRLVGDALAPRSCLEAVHDGHLAGFFAGVPDEDVPPALIWEL